MQTTGPDQVLLLLQQLQAENEALRANLARQQDDTVRASLDTGTAMIDDIEWAMARVAAGKPKAGDDTLARPAHTLHR